MALYPKAVHKLIPPGSRDPRITPTQAVVHVDAGNARTLYGWFTNPAANGVESHFHVRTDGTVEQYRDTNYQADAQVGGAAKAVSIETQGYESGEWSPAQLAALVALLRWLLTVHPGILPRPCPDPYAAGLGYHSMFAPDRAGTWARDGRTCPGPKRIRQFRDTILPTLTGDDMPSAEEIAAAVWRYPVKRLDNTPAPAGDQLGNANVYAYRAHRALAGLLAREAVTAADVAEALAPQLAEVLTGAGPVSREDLEAALRSVLGSVDEEARA